MKTKFNGILTLLLLALVVQISFAQNRTISGIVSDESGPLPGVSVLKKGTTQGTETDFDGKYTIEAKASDVLVFSFVGMETTEKKVGGVKTLNVTMKSANMLEEIVVTAMGVKREEKSVGYAVSNIGKDELEKANEGNVIQALAGKAAGIQVIGSGGTPGASSKIIIRGSSTISGNNQPLIIVDGVPYDNSTNTTSAGDYPYNKNLSGVNNSNRALDINPEDIESVSVLKGAVAAALYGARAGNGAIIYTTKKGAKGLGVELSFKTEFSEVSKLPELQSTYAQGSNGNFITADPGKDFRHGTSYDISGGTSNSWGPKIAETKGLSSYNNVDNFFRSALLNETNIALFGGSENTTFRVSLGNLKQEGIIPNTDLHRIATRINGSTEITDKFKVAAGVAWTRTAGTKAQNGSNLAGIMLGLMRAPASFDLKNYIFPNGNQRTYFKWYDNPYYTAYKNPFNDEVNRFNGRLKLDYNFNKWVNLSLTGSFDTYSEDRRQVFAISSLGDDNNSGKGQVNYDDISSSSYYMDLLLNGGKMAMGGFNFNYLLGLNIQSDFYESNFSRGRDLAVKGLYNLGNASELYASNSQEKTITRALFSQLEFSYDDFIFLTLTGRNEWASTYGKDNNNSFFPSATLSYVPSSQFEMPNWFNYIKLRGGYSEVGIAPDPYRTLTPYVKSTITDGFTNGLSFPYKGKNGYGISSTLGNLNLKPERVKAYEFGGEFGFLQNRLRLAVTYYSQKTVDMLLYVPQPAESGFTREYQNGAELENKGIELEFNAKVIKSENFKWDLSVNWAKNKSEVLKLADGVEEVSIESAFKSIGSYAIVGQPLGALFGTKWERNKSGQLIIDQTTGLPTVAGETGNIGDPNPDWTMGIRNTFSYKKFTLSALLDFREGGDIWNGTYARLNKLGRSLESADRERTYIIPGVDKSGNPNKKEISANTYYTKFLGDAGAAKEQSVQDGSWIRLRDVSLSYKLDTKLSKFIREVQFSIAATNLWLKTDYKGVDPETSLTGAGSNLNGFDYFNNPGVKSYTFGVKVKF